MGVQNRTVCLGVLDVAREAARLTPALLQASYLGSIVFRCFVVEAVATRLEAVASSRPSLVG